MYSLVLAVHICGSIALVCVGALSGWVGMFSKKEWYRGATLALAAATCFEIISGSLLAVLSLETTAREVCEGLVLYGAIIAIIFGVLLWRMKKEELQLPLVAFYPPGISLSFLLCIAALGY